MSFPRPVFVPLSLAASALATLGGCGQEPTVIAGDYSLSYRESGGFAGLHHEVLVDSATLTLGSSHAYGAEPDLAAMTAEEVHDVATTLETLDFFSLHDGPTCAGCSDSLAFGISLTVGARTHEVSWENGWNDGPINGLVSDLLELEASKFPAPPP